MFAKRCRILHTSGIRKIRHKDPSCTVIVVPHFSVGVIIKKVAKYKNE